MIKPFSQVKVLIWDFDGTLYAPNPQLWGEIREAEYRAIMICRNWNHDRAASEFHKLYKSVYQSATQTVAAICNYAIPQAAVAFEKYYDRRKYLKKDEKLMRLFASLKGYTHYILANGVRQYIEAALEAMGLNREAFAEIITSEMVGDNKPGSAGFRYILEKTKLSPEMHLMIGDRESVDLVPAKNLGMKTCLVWAEKKSQIADMTLPSIYEIRDLLT